MSNSKRIVSGVQTDVSFANTKENLDRMFSWLASDELRDSHLIVFPECMLSGYCFASLEEGLTVAESLEGLRCRPLLNGVRPTTNLLRLACWS